MKPTVLLTGKTGQVGFELNRLLPTIANVVAPGREHLDLQDAATISRTIQSVRPQLLVNAAAYSAVDAAEKDQSTATAINASAVGMIAEEMRNVGGGVVHFSTDYVFDGRKDSPYNEMDTPNPLNVYGRTKLAGEEALRISGVPYLTLRTSWVYATRGKNFMLTILRLATEKEELRVVGDQTGAPTCAVEIAAVTVKILAGLLRRPVGFDLSEVKGTYHATAAGQTTWCNFTEAILIAARTAPKTLPWLAEATRGRPLITQRVVPVSTLEYGSSTPRPRFSVLSNACLNRTFGVALPFWSDQLIASFATATR
jgi:dTDP-4-dehydrorhamnose reductase